MHTMRLALVFVLIPCILIQVNCHVKHKQVRQRYNEKQLRDPNDGKYEQHVQYVSQNTPYGYPIEEYYKGEYIPPQAYSGLQLSNWPRKDVLVEQSEPTFLNGFLRPGYGLPNRQPNLYEYWLLEKQKYNQEHTESNEHNESSEHADEHDDDNYHNS